MFRDSRYVPAPFAARCAAGAFGPCPGAWAAGHFCPFRSASVITIPCFCAKHPCHILPKLDEMNSHWHRTIHTVSGCFPCRSFSCRPALPAGLRPSVLPGPDAKKAEDAGASSAFCVFNSILIVKSRLIRSLPPESPPECTENFPSHKSRWKGTRPAPPGLPPPRYRP